MVTVEQVKQYIAAELNCIHLDVEGDGHHFFATVVSETFAGKRLVERHRLIKEVIKTRLLNNEIHALSIVKAQTPDEWEERQQGLAVSVLTGIETESNDTHLTKTNTMLDIAD